MMIDGVTLRKLREVYRSTREDFGALMNVTGRFVSYVESGDRKLPQYRADMLVRELELTPDKLARLMAVYEETIIQTQ
ncbi:helix-turn-helix domain-containing protein [Paenibacillus sp. HGF5]|uniref:helix-turn-helix domain-containing protein n=1 Tax=Paenibacillus sp. HGF5 TaxID=908341 RepID=UPI0002072A25|nr:helix-turn-helix transcriptional regulator [Paenibacillus sp. HGF5]EGG36565.1 hypothetical protein HMPREF9412_6590 [Paenibacillus sp. HGF5]